MDDVKNPQKKGLIGARNFYITVNKDIKLGAWYVMYNSSNFLLDKSVYHTVLRENSHGQQY